MPQLFETQDDIKPYMSGANINNDIATLAGYLDTAAEEYMIPVLGRAYWNDFVEKYNSNELSAAQIAALKYLQKPLAHYTYLLLANDGGLNVDDSGLSTVESGSAKRPYQWQVREFKRNQLRQGWIAMGAMLRYLYSVKSDHTTWWESTERETLWGLVVWDMDRWKLYDGIDGMGTYWKIRNHVKEAVDYELTANLGTEFATEYNTWLLARGTNADYTALLPYVEPVVVHAAVARACETLPLQMTADGIYIDEVNSGLQNDEVKKSADQDRVNRKYNVAKTKLNDAIVRLRKYLDTNASAVKYAEYFESELYNISADSHEIPAELITGPTFML